MSETMMENAPDLLVKPVTESQRLKLIDALRGVALLGILLMNIPVFAMPSYFSESFKSDPTNINFWVDAVISVVFEGKMRALFGMIVYLLRKVNPIYLAMTVPLVAALDFTAGTLFYQHIRTQRLAYVDASSAAVEGKSLSDAQNKALSQWREIEKTFIPNREDVKINTSKMKSDYATVAGYLRPLSFQIQTVFLPIIIWDSLTLMLLGVALYRWGFFSGAWSKRNYWQILTIGYSIGLPLSIYGYYHHFLYQPTLEASLARMEREPIEWVNLIYPFQRILLVMAHVSVIILLYKSQHAQSLFRRLEAVGQMAFTNYIMQSVICTLFFFGYGLNYFAELQFYQLYFVAVAIWILQLIASPLWLQRFRFGPLEWVWRSLTYWKLQRLLRTED